MKRDVIQDLSVNWLKEADRLIADEIAYIRIGALTKQYDGELDPEMVADGLEASLCLEPKDRVDIALSILEGRSVNYRYN